MKRRGNGEGSVFKIKDGTWRATCPGGKPSFRGSTRAEALRRRDTYMRQHRQTLALPRAARDSFAAILQQWLDTSRDSLRPRTIESYQTTATRYIIPTIGRIPVGKLTPADVEDAMRGGKSPRTKNYIRSVIHSALQFAVDRDLIHANVARKVATVTVPEAHVEIPPAEHWSALIAEIEKESPGTKAMLLVLAFCGLREGEVCGLRWSDYDGGSLRILRAASREGALVPVKTSAGRRSVPVPKQVAVALAEWREAQRAARERHGARWQSASVPDLMFSTRYGSVLSLRNVLRVVHRVTERTPMGVKSAHFLRHAAISHLIADGVDIKTVQTIAGHSSIRVTLDTYGHLVPGQLDKAREAMERRG